MGKRDESKSGLTSRKFWNRTGDMVSDSSGVRSSNICSLCGGYNVYGSEEKEKGEAPEFWE